MANKANFIGLFPAGGLAKRLGINSSKEVLPVLNEAGELQPVGQFLLESYHAAGIENVHIILRKEKQDIRSTFKDGDALGLKINYLELQCFLGTPYTLDEAWPLVKNDNVALGFPDIILKPGNTFKLLKACLLESDADIVLGLFPTDQTQKSDMAEFDSKGTVKQLHIKPKHTTLTHTWVTAVWRPRFSQFMHEYLESKRYDYETDSNLSEPFVGTVINAALQNSFSVHGLVIPDGQMLDIGTHDDLAIATTPGFFSKTADQ